MTRPVSLWWTELPRGPVAPVLRRLLTQRREEIRVRKAERSHVQTLLLSAQRNLEHRELQLIRAGAIGRPAYLVVRQRKLDAARKEVARLQQRLRALERAQ